MNKIIYVPDVHFKNDIDEKTESECYNNGLFKVFDWLYEKYKDDTLVINGDLFDVSNPSNTVRELVTKTLIRFKKVIVNTGNHDFAKSNIGNALLSMSLHNNIEIISEQKCIDVDDIKMHFFPHNPIFSKMKEYEEIKESDCHYTMLHCMPYEEVFGNKEMKEKASVTLDIEPKVCHIYSHIHKYNEYINIKGHKVLIGGIVQPTRELEQEWPCCIYELNEDSYTKIDIPVFMTIKAIDFDDSVDDLNKDYLYNVMNAPSKDSVYEKFKDFYIRKRGIQVLRSESQHLIENDIEFNIENFSDDYANWATENDKSNEYIECVYEFSNKI